MYHHAKRPTPLLCGIAGSVCAIGVIAIVARGLDNFSTFTLREPFDTISYVLAVTCWFAGPAMVGWLRTMTVKQENAELKAENEDLRKHFAKVDELIAAVRAADQQGEMNFVRLGKLLKMAEEARERRISAEDTQDIPKRRLQGIPGGGGA